jgi:actin-related protein
MTTTIAPETLDREGGELVVRVQTIAVVDDETFRQAGELLRTVKVYLGRVAEVFTPMVKAAHEAHRAVLAQRQKVEAHALEAEKLLKQQMGDYQREQERKRLEEQERQRQEQLRLEREERERVEAERRRRQKEEEDRRLEEAARAEQRGDASAARKLIEEPVVVTAPAPRPVFAPPALITAPPKVEGVSFREEWTYEVVNAELIPREYLAVDDKKLAGVVRAMRGSCRIPGVRVFSRTVTSARSR